MLKGKHAALRAIERSDLPLLLEWRNRPAYRRYFRETRELNSDQQILWFEKIVNADPATRMFSIIELTTGRLLGACGLCYIDWPNRSADFSIYIGADDLYIDTLYAPDAANILMRYAFQELGLHRVWTEIYDIDIAKKKFFTDLGFTLDGRHRETHWTEGRWHDSLFFGLLESEHGLPSS